MKKIIKKIKDFSRTKVYASSPFQSSLDLTGLESFLKKAVKRINKLLRQKGKVTLSTQESKDLLTVCAKKGKTKFVVLRIYK